MSEKISVRIPSVIGINCNRRRMMYCAIPLDRLACEVPTSDFHHRSDRPPEHVVPGRDAAPLPRQRLDVGERLDHRLRPAEVREACGDLAVADEERAVARGAGHESALRLEQAVDVVEARDPDAELRR